MHPFQIQTALQIIQTFTFLKMDLPWLQYSQLNLAGYTLTKPSVTESVFVSYNLTMTSLPESMT